MKPSAPASATRAPPAKRALAELTSDGIEPEYVELVSADGLAPIERIDGDVLAVLAAPVGGTRLIDNEPIQAPNGDGRP